jgi:hypothetical protein
MAIITKSQINMDAPEILRFTIDRITSISPKEIMFILLPDVTVPTLSQSKISLYTMDSYNWFKTILV